MTTTAPLTQKQIEAKFKRVIKKDHTKKNEINSIEFSDVRFDGEYYDATVTVVMASTCELGATMTWEFLVSYEASNESMFTSYERKLCPELITEATFSVKAI